MSALSDIHSLQAAMREADVQRHHLGRVIGQHMGAFEKTIKRIKGRKPPRVPHSNLAGQGEFPFQSLAESLLRNATRQTVSGLLSSSSGMSQGQAMADLAREISRAMSRNL